MEIGKELNDIPSVEILLFLLSFVVVPPLVSVYRRTVAPMGARNGAFEAWCCQNPMVAAVFLPGAVQREAVDLLQSHLDRVLVNTEGPFPFVGYALKLEVVRWGESVLSVHVRECFLRRGISEARPLLRELLSGGRALVERARPEELWLHGAFYRGEELRSLEESSWRVRIAQGLSSARSNEVEFAARAYRELPFWLRTRPGGPPRDGRAKALGTLVLAAGGS